MIINNGIDFQKGLKIKKIRLVFSIIIFYINVIFMSPLLIVACNKGNAFMAAIAFIFLVLGIAYLLRTVYKW